MSNQSSMRCPTKTKFVSLAIAGVAWIYPLASSHATLRVWSGGATMSNAWTNAPNWTGNAAPVSGDDLQFPFDASKSNSNDNYTNGMTFNSIQFWHGANSTPNRTYDLTGNSIALNAGVSAVNNNPSLWPNSVNNVLRLNSNQIFSTGPFTSLALNGAINLNGNNLTFDTASLAPIDVYAVISGAGGLIKTNSGTLTLYTNNTYPGSTVIGGGTLALSNHGAIPDSTNIAVTGVSALFSAVNGLVLNSGQTLSGIGSVSANVTAIAG